MDEETLRLRAKLAHHEYRAYLFLCHAQEAQLETTKELYERLGRTEIAEASVLRNELELREQIPVHAKGNANGEDRNATRGESQ